jgi:hypothetical protein
MLPNKNCDDSLVGESDRMAADQSHSG